MRTCEQTLDAESRPLGDRSPIRGNELKKAALCKGGWIRAAKTEGLYPVGFLQI